MVLKKPYGFLIKHFKIINLLLLVPILYVILKFGDIAGFFQDYVSAKYNTPETVIAGKYITILTYFILIFLISYNLFTYILMKNKKKPTKEYAFSAIYYTVLLVMTLLFYNTMSSIEINQIEASGINMVRDFARICPIPAYVIFLLTLFKGIGFNIKTFSFDNNFDLQVTEDDEAEFELKVGADSYTIKRNIVHNIRELKYYILENKFVFTCIGAVLIIMIGSSIYMNFGVYNKKYRINQAFALDTFTLSLKNSYITNVDMGGKKLSKGHYYLAVEIGILNRSKDTASIDKSNFRIYLKDDIIYPSYDLSSRFIDIGNSYEGRGIAGEKSDNYVLVYELTSEQIKRSYQMKILGSLTYDSGKLIPKYKLINIKPENIVKQNTLGESTIGKQLTLEKTLLKNTKYKLKSIDFVNSYTYKYKHCFSKNDCINTTNTIVPSQGNTLVVIEDEILYDETSSYYKNSKRNFYEDFVKLQYDYNNYNKQEEKQSAALKDVTPSTLKGKKVLEVTSLVKKGTNRYLAITIRNQTILIKIDK